MYDDPYAYGYYVDCEPLCRESCPEPRGAPYRPTSSRENFAAAAATAAGVDTPAVRTLYDPAVRNERDEYERTLGPDHTRLLPQLRDGPRLPSTPAPRPAFVPTFEGFCPGAWGSIWNGDRTLLFFLLVLVAAIVGYYVGQSRARPVVLMMPSGASFASPLG